MDAEQDSAIHGVVGQRREAMIGRGAIGCPFSVAVVIAWNVQTSSPKKFSSERVTAPVRELAPDV